MESAIAIYKLIILYLLDRAAGEEGLTWGGAALREEGASFGQEKDRAVAGEIAMPQITNFLLENAYVDFRVLVRTYEEIEKNGYVEGHQAGDVMFLRITPEGRQTVRMFRDQLSPEIRAKVEAFLKENGRTLREERSVIGEYYKASYGGYTAHLVVREDRKELFSIDLNMPDEASAKAIAKKFREKSADVYGAIIEQLM